MSINTINLESQHQERSLRLAKPQKTTLALLHLPLPTLPTERDLTLITAWSIETITASPRGALSASHPVHLTTQMTRSSTATLAESKAALEKCIIPVRITLLVEVAKGIANAAEFALWARNTTLVPTSIRLVYSNASPCPRTRDNVEALLAVAADTW